MTGAIDPRLAAAEAMARALTNYPCRCEHNVLYAGGSVEQVVTKMCARHSSLAAWKLANNEPTPQ